MAVGRTLMLAIPLALASGSGCDLSMEGKDRCLLASDCLDGNHCVDGRCLPGSCSRHCEGRQCGDDGCGGECGPCPGGMSCNEGTRKCEQCVADCTFQGADKACGSSGCVGLVCGSCSDGKSCDPYTFRCGWGGAGDAGAFYPDAGVGPHDAGHVGGDASVLSRDAGSCRRDCEGKQCGDDGCGGECSPCPASMTCNAATHRCEACLPQCSHDGRDKQCGAGGCAGLSCGICDDGEACGPDFLCEPGAQAADAGT